MNRVKLAGTDLEVSPVCLGCWQFNGGAQDITWSPQEEKVSLSIVDQCFKEGVNFFDTAECYSNHVSETILGKALEGRRRDAIVATKFGANKKEGMMAKYNAADIEHALNESLKALKTDYVDLYQIHGSILMENVEETVKELKRQQALGKIRHYGISNFGPLSMKEFNEAGGAPVTNQLPYNLLWRAIEYDIIDSCDKYNCDILAYSPLQQGLLTGKYLTPDSLPEGRRRGKHFNVSRAKYSRHGGEGCEDLTFETINKIKGLCDGQSMAASSLSWLVQQPRVASVIVGASRPEQITENCKLINLTKEKLDSFNAATQALKEKLGPEPDQYAAQSRFR